MIHNHYITIIDQLDEPVEKFESPKIHYSK
jgi:hypothetical protein